MNLFFVILACILLLVLAFFFRVKPIWKHRHRGCDAYYFLLCNEEFRRRKRIPIVLPPYYLLENQEQWYPPGFNIFLSLFPERVVKKYYWAISPGVDCLILALLYVVVYLVTGNLWLAVLSGFLYGITPAVIGECFSLTSRQLGSLLLTVVLLSLFGFVNTNNFFLLGLSIFAGFLVLMTHKLTTQLLWFVLPTMSLALLDLTYFLVAIAIVIATVLLSMGFYLKVLRGHFDILSFWNKNWKNLWAHQVYDSPIYGDESRRTPGKYFQRGLKDIYWQLTRFGSNYFVVLLIFPVLFYTELSLLERQMLWWAILTYLLAALTLFIPQLRFLGEGDKYLKLAAFPIAYLAMTPLLYGWNVSYYFYPLLGATILLSFRSTLKAQRSIERSTTPSLDSDLQEVIDFLSGEGVGAIGCIPCDLGDTIAFHCKKSVLWGTHNYSFRKAEPFFPVLRKPLDYFISEYKLSHYLIDSNYAPAELLGLSPTDRVFNAKRYEVYRTNYGESNPKSISAE